MKFWEQTCLQLKYEGKTYRELADQVYKITKIKVSQGTIENYFAVDGKFYLPYMQYEAEQNNWNADHAKQQYKRLGAYTDKIKVSLLKLAIKTKDYRLAFDIAKDIADRSGNVVVRKTELQVDDRTTKQMTYEQYLAECTRMGIDPRSGDRVPKAPVQPN